MAASNLMNDARLSLRLPSEWKRTIEEAAAQLGLSVTDFAVATLVEDARQVLARHQATELSSRDRDLFLALLDDADTGPNEALRAAAQRYNKRRE